MNYQNWDGYTDPRFGYGSMLWGLRDHAPAGVKFSPKASVDVHVGVPFSKKSWLSEAHRVCFTMWETDVLPAGFRNWLGQYDQVLVPCDHNAELFGRVCGDVRVVPLGVDRKVWFPRERPGGEVFRFAAGGSLWRRKGLDIVVEAFNRLKLHNAELHIKAAPHARDTPTKPLGKNIFLHREWMTLDQQVEWFNEADCYVAVSRGEGFGLMPLQAIALGVPNIVSLTTGQTQFAGLATYQIPCAKSRADTIGMWDEPDLGEVMDAMLDAYRNRERNNVVARKQAAYTSNWTWGKAVKQLLQAVPTGTLLDNPEWVTPNVEVDIRVKRRVNADIGKHNYRMVPGITYRVPEGVFQVLSDADALEDQ